MPNEEMRRFWSEEGGPTWVQHEERHDAMLAPFEELLEMAADPSPGEHVLDVGCGFGTTTVAMARAVGADGRVMALDLSDAMLARTGERAAEAGLGNVIVRQADAQTERLPAGHFHLVVSRFGVMFFDDPAAAFANLARALVPQGRLAFVCWQALAANEWMARPLAAIDAALASDAPPARPSHAPGPFAFGDGERLRAILEAAGFAQITLRDEGADVLLGGGRLDEAVEQAMSGTEARRRLAGVEGERYAEVKAAVRAALAPYEHDG